MFGKLTIPRDASIIDGGVVIDDGGAVPDVPLRPREEDEESDVGGSKPR